MRHTPQKLKEHGFYGYTVIMYAGEPHVFIGVPCKDLRAVISAYDVQVVNGFHKPQMLFLGNYEGDREYAPQWTDDGYTYCSHVMARVQGFNGFPDFLVHHSVIQHLFGLQEMKHLKADVVMPKIERFVNELVNEALQAQVEQTLDAAAFDKAEQEAMFPQEQVEQVVYAPVGTVDLPTTQYDKREYSTDAKDTVVVEVLVGSNGIGLLQIMNALKEKGYDNKRYGDKPFKTLIEFNKVLKEEGLIDLVDNGFYQHVTDIGRSFGLHDLHFPKKNAWFWNLYDAKVVDILGDLWLDAGLMVQDGVYYRLIGIQEHYEVQGELLI